MSLNYDIRALPDVLKEGPAWAVTESFIFVTMAIGLSEITASNLKEWRVRLRIAGCILSGIDVLERGLDARVGLKTNASTMTRAQFLKNVAASVERDMAWREVSARESAKA